MYLCKNLSLGTFLGCSYFFTISEADVLINSVLRQNTACSKSKTQLEGYSYMLEFQLSCVNEYRTMPRGMLGTEWDK